MKRAASPDSPMFESMHRFKLAQFTVRVWREEESLERSYPRGDLFDAFTQTFDMERSPDVSRAFHYCSRVTAVEVLDESGNGSVTYTVWP